jgi:NodT family efflux transporter outer membrane factor (OMF) lipoprotein
MAARSRFLPLHALALAALTLGASGCAVTRTPYTPPQAAVPAQWDPPTPPAAPAAAATDRWWTRFEDPTLTRLVDEALQRNADLAVAALSVKQARLAAELADNDRWPVPSASLSSQSQRAINHTGTRSQTHSASVGVSWELDLWQRLAALSDAASWEAQATEQDRQATALSLAGTVATDYWQLAYLNQRVASAQASLAYARRTRELVQAQYEAGAVSGLERQQAEQTVLSQQASLSALTEQRAQARHALVLLFDHAPSADALAALLPQEPQALPEHPLPPVAAGVPAQVLGRRPDLRAAELRLRETLAQHDAAAAAYYPTLSLTGALGSSSNALGSLLTNPVATLGAGLTLPFLRVREMHLSNAKNQAAYESAVIGYRQTLYSALADVQNALSNREALARQGEWLAGSLAATRQVEAMTEVRYRHGAVALKDWLDAQESRRTAEVALAENQLARLQNQVTLYQALGGGV